MAKLNDRVKDKLTGFEGIVVGRTEWLYGCTRCGIDATKLSEGRPIETQWFDEQRLDVIRSAKVEVRKDSTAVTGGPHNDPKPRKSY